MCRKMSSVPSPAREEAEAFDSIKPFDDGDFIAADGGYVDVRASGQRLRGMHGCRLVHRDDAKHLQALGAQLRLADDAGAFLRGLVTAAAQRRHMQQDIRRAVVRHDEPIALGDVKPFDRASHFDKIKSGLVAFRTSGQSAKLILKTRFSSQLTNPPADPEQDDFRRRRHSPARIDAASMNHLGKDTIRSAASNRVFSLFTLCCGQLARNLRDWRRCDKRLKEHATDCIAVCRRADEECEPINIASRARAKSSAPLAARLMFAKDERPSKSWSQP